MDHKFYIGDELDLLGKRISIIKPGWCVHGGMDYISENKNLKYFRYCIIY